MKNLILFIFFITVIICLILIYIVSINDSVKIITNVVSKSVKIGEKNTKSPDYYTKDNYLGGGELKTVTPEDIFENGFKHLNWISEVEALEYNFTEIRKKAYLDCEYKHSPPKSRKEAFGILDKFYPQGIAYNMAYEDDKYYYFSDYNTKSFKSGSIIVKLSGDIWSWRKDGFKNSLIGSSRTLDP
jgi:hypothetical protein